MVGDTKDDESAPGRPTCHRVARPAWWRRIVQAEKRRAGQRGSRSWTWRVATPVVFVAAGTLLVTSQINAGGTDLRPGRYDDLADLAEKQSDQLQTLRTRIGSLNREIEGLTEGLDSGELTAAQNRAERLRAPAGVTPVRGPGITVTLDDAPKSIRATVQEEDRAKAIVHQQDIQAVANALWNGGAEAMIIQGQRVVSTTGIKCVGNTVILHGIPYSPPYVLTAIGDQDALERSVRDSTYVQSYLQDAAAYQLGFDLQRDDDVKAPAYDGSMEMRYAKVVAPEAS